MTNIYDYVKRHVNLADFLQTEIGCTLQWLEPNVSARTICPFHDHKEKKASFNIKFVEEDSIWIFNCLGCGKGGTIVDFFVQYYDLPDSKAAVRSICKKFNFENIDTAVEDLTASKKKANIRRKIEMANIVTSNQCRMLLRRDFDKHKKWVAESYKKINKALDLEDLELVQKIGDEASRKIRGK